MFIFPGNEQFFPTPDEWHNKVYGKIQTQILLSLSVKYAPMLLHRTHFEVITACIPLRHRTFTFMVMNSTV